VDPGGAAIEGHTEGCDIGKGTPPDPRAGFEHHHAATAGHQHARGGEARNARTDDDDIGILRRRGVNRPHDCGSAGKSQNATA